MLLVFVAVLSLSGPVPARGQLSSASLEIRVEDPANRSVPDAHITVAASGSQWMSEGVTTDTGVYRVPHLPDGSYEIVVQAPGFASWRHTVAVGAPKTTRVRVTLALDPQSETIVVTETFLEPASEVPVRTVGRAETESLPLNQRRPLDFALLSTPVNRDSLQVLAVAATSGLSVAGNGPRTNTLIVDGVEMNDEVSGAFRSQLPVDAVQEVQVRAGESDIRQGRYLGGAVEITTRSGANQLHGSTFGFFRHRSLDASNAFSPVDDLAYTRTQFGASLGGAVQPDKTFFFLAGEELREQSSVYHRIGAGRDLFAYSPQQQQLLGNASMAQYLAMAQRGAAIARTGQNPAGQPLPYCIEPLGDLPDTFPRRLRGTSLSARLDRHIGAHHRVSALASYGGTEDTALEVQNSDQVLGLSSGERFTRMHVIDPTISVALESAWGSSLVMDSRLSWARRNFEILPTSNATPANLSGVAFLGQEPFSPVRRVEKRWQFSHTTNWTRGDTLVRFGGDLLYAPLDMDFARRSRGLFVFGERPAPGFADAPPLTTVQAYGLGLPLQFVQEMGQTRAETGKTSFGIFGSVRRQFGERFSSELGLRYDQERPHGEALLLPNEIQEVYSAVDAVQKPPADTNNWAPRVGLAYRLRRDGSLVLRASYSMHYDRLITHPLWAARVLNGVTVTQTTLVGPAAIEVFRSPTQQLQESVSGGPPSGLLVYDADWRTGYSQNVVAALESSVGQNGQFTLRYLGVRGTALGRSRDRNPSDSMRAAAFLEAGGANPQLLAMNFFRPHSGAASVMTIEGAARSSYHSLSAEIGKRWSRLSWSGSYTWAKAIDDADDVFPLTRAQDQTDFRSERGLSLYDQRHRLVSTVVWQSASTGRGWNAVWANWTVSGIGEVASGRPYNVILGFDNNLDQFPSSDRPDVLVANGSVRYVVPDRGRAGNLGRNALTGHAYASVSARLMRSFPVNERVSLSASVEAFNLLNRNNIRSVNTNFRNAGQPLTAFDPRQIQLGLRVDF
ncbi:MAG: TonB-dependent receptor [Bryobacteraceae bacterium]|nr:TonB-dependent receptor [Bryobacteraceae bacterium]